MVYIKNPWVKMTDKFVTAAKSTQVKQIMSIKKSGLAKKDKNSFGINIVWQ